MLQQQGQQSYPVCAQLPNPSPSETRPGKAVASGGDSWAPGAHPKAGIWQAGCWDQAPELPSWGLVLLLISRALLLHEANTSWPSCCSVPRGDNPQTWHCRRNQRTPGVAKSLTKAESTRTLQMEQLGCSPRAGTGSLQQGWSCGVWLALRMLRIPSLPRGEQTIPRGVF